MSTTMLLKLVLTTAAMVANALVINPNTTSTTTLPLLKRTAFTRPYSYPIPNTNNDNTYTVQQMDQFREGHVDALYTCSVVVREAARNPARYDRIFSEYFKPADRNLVLSKSLMVWQRTGSVNSRQLTLHRCVQGHPGLQWCKARQSKTQRYQHRR